MNLLSAFLSAEAVDTTAVTEAITEAVTTVAPAVKSAPINNGFVVIMGVGTVFIGLICIILLIKLMSIVTAGFAKSETAPAAAPAPAPAPVAAPAPAPTAVIENRAEIVAAVCAAAAEELGTDVSALRVVSFKKIS